MKQAIWIRSALLVLSAITALGCGIGGITSEPKTAADCDAYEWNRRQAKSCNDYVAAREALFAGRLADAEKHLARSGLSKEPWAADFTAEVNARRLRAMQPDTLDVAAVKDVFLEIDDKLCPGRHHVGVLVTLADGKRKETFTDPAQKAGFLDYAPFEITVKNATLDPATGTLTTSASLAAVEEGYLVTVALEGRPDVKKEKVVLPKLECMNQVFVAGSNGASGSDGSSGESVGSDQCQGRRGGDGGRGGKGEHGQHAPSLTVDVGVRSTKLFPKLTVARVGSEWFFAPEGGTILISASGGNGGDGGSGGQGGRGESPYSNCKSGKGPDGEGGRGGEGGDGGDGGDGASVLVRYDAASPELAKAVDVAAGGGSGGREGRGGSAGSSGSGHFESANQGKPGQPGRAGRSGTVSVRPETGLFK